MARFTVYSPFDGGEIPAPNEEERDILLSQGYLAAPPAADSEASDEQAASEDHEPEQQAAPEAEEQTAPDWP